MVWRISDAIPARGMSDSIPPRGTSDPLLPQLNSAFDPAIIPVGVFRDIGLLISKGTAGFTSRRLVVSECF